MKRRTLSFLLVGLLAALVLCAAAGAADPPLKLSTPTATEKTQALTELKALKTKPWESMSGYSREAFSASWRDDDHNGCSAREDALLRYGKKVKTGERCKVLSGSWYDPYGPMIYTNPRQLDIDHIVPLAAAWRAGANHWSEDKRREYANSSAVLLPVWLSLNRQKGDKAPESWMPPNKAFAPRYAILWIHIKSQYQMAVTKAERAKLQGILQGAK